MNPVQPPVSHLLDNRVAWLTIERPEARNALSNAGAPWAVPLSQDAKQGPAAFRDKRAPDWKGY